MSENNPGLQPPQYPNQQYPNQQFPYQQPTPQQYGVPQMTPAPAQSKVGTLSIVTLIASFFIGYLTLIFGILALRQNWAKGTRGNGMAWAGIIVGAVLGTVQFFFLYTLINLTVIGAGLPEY